MALVEHRTNWISNKVIAAAIDVHRHLGPGLLESSYHACLCRELDLRGIAYQSKLPAALEYKGTVIPKGYVIDLLIEHLLVVEIKALEKVFPIHTAQLLTYMRLQKVPSGLLINFNVAVLVHGVTRLLL